MDTEILKIILVIKHREHSKTESEITKAHFPHTTFKVSNNSAVYIQMQGNFIKNEGVDKFVKKKKKKK